MQRKFSFLAVVLLAVVAIRFLFPDWWGHTNTRVIEGYGDGYKAYHAILYHAKYDSTYSWYEGMNYPYGDHVVPGASQPILSNSIRLLEDLGWPVADYGWAIVHFSMLLGIVLGALFSFLLFRRLGVSWFLSTLAALLMTFLAPQLARIVGHYGLAHVEVLPATLYFLKRWEEQPGWKNSLAVGLCVWFFSQIHFYYFAILAFLLGGYLLARWLLVRDWKRWWYYGWTLFLMFGLPALYFSAWFKLTDPIADRNDHPWGFFAYHSELSGIFTSHTQAYWRSIQEKVGYLYPGFEGQAYIGLVFGLFLLFILLRWLFSFLISLRQKTGLSAMAQPILQAADKQRLFLQSLLFSASGIAIFSFGFPLTVVGGEAWLEHLGPIRQFRSIGRFAWIFYYAIHLAFWVELDAYLRRKLEANSWKKAAFPILLTFLATTFTLYEIHHYWEAKDFRLDNVEGFNSPTLAERTALDFDRYQAIIPLPYYNLGSGNFWLDQSGFIGQRVQTLSWQTGLSTTGAMLTRTSFSQTLKQLQLITEPYRLPAIFEDLPNQKPFLLAYDAERYHEFGDRSNHLIGGAILRYQDPPFYLFELPLSSWAARINTSYAATDSLWRSKVVLADSLPHSQVIYISYDSQEPQLWAAADSADSWLPVANYTAAYTAGGGRFSFQHSQSETAGETKQGIVGGGYRGNAFQGDLGKENTVLEIATGLALEPGDYLLSFWMDIGHARYPPTRFELQTQIGEEQPGPAFGSSVREWVKVMDTNGWAMVEFPIKISERTTGIRLNLSRPLLKGRIFQLDDVLLRPEELEVVGRMGQDTLYHNNRYRLPIE